MTEAPKEPTFMDTLVNQINSYKAQQAQANATRDDVVAQCEGGIKTCLWMIGVLNEAKAKDDAAKAAEEAAAETACNIFDAARAALQVVQDKQSEARAGFDPVACDPHLNHAVDLQRPETGLIGTDVVVNPQQVHAGELEPHIPTDEELGPRETH